MLCTVLMAVLLTSCTSIFKYSDEVVENGAEFISRYANLTGEDKAIFKAAFINAYDSGKINFTYDELDRKYTVTPNGFKNTYIDIYFTVTATGNITPVFEANYEGSDWLFIDEIYLYPDGAYRYYLRGIYLNFDHNIEEYGVSEYCNFIAPDSMYTGMTKLVAEGSEQHSVRFVGKSNTHTFNFNNKQVENQRTVLELYEMLMR